MFTQKRLEFSAEIRRASLADLSFDSFKCESKPLVTERLRQIVQRLCVESFDRVLIVCGDKNDRRNPNGIDLLENTESVSLRHLYIEKKQVRLRLLEQLYSVGAIAALSDDFDIGIVAEQCLEVPPRNR